MPTAHKILSTKDWLTLREENRQLKLLQSIDALKDAGLWSFKQLKALPEPARVKSHQDYLLEEMRWMRADFKQERKWKIAMSYQMALWVKDWHEATDKAALCSKFPKPRPQETSSTEQDTAMTDSKDSSNSVIIIEPTPALPPPPSPTKRSLSTSPTKRTLPTSPRKRSLSTSPTKKTLTSIPIIAPINTSVADQKTMEVPNAPLEAATPSTAETSVVVPMVIDTPLTAHPEIPNEQQPTEQQPSSVSISVQSMLFYSLLDNEEDKQDGAVHLPEMSAYHFSEWQQGDTVSQSQTIQPVSHLMLEKSFVQESRLWDEYGNLKSSHPTVDEVYWLVSTKRYDNSPLVSRKYLFPHHEVLLTHTLSHTALFGKKDDKTIAEPLVSSRQKTSNQKREVTWSTEEDDTLFSLASQYQYNWSLVSCILASLRLNPAVRSEWDCFTRFNHLSSKLYKPEIEIDAFMLPVRMSKSKAFASAKRESDKSKMSRLVTRFEVIRKAIKKRDSQKASSNSVYLDFFA